jgi:hypothetical protein
LALSFFQAACFSTVEYLLFTGERRSDKGQLSNTNFSNLQASFTTPKERRSTSMMGPMSCFRFILPEKGVPVTDLEQRLSRPEFKRRSHMKERNDLHHGFDEGFLLLILSCKQTSGDCQRQSDVQLSDFQNNFNPLLNQQG